MPTRTRTRPNSLNLGDFLYLCHSVPWQKLCTITLNHTGFLMHSGHYQRPRAGTAVGEDRAQPPLFASLRCISQACLCRCNPKDTKIKTVSFVVKLITFPTSLRGGRQKPQARKSHLSNLTNSVFPLSQRAN